MSRFSDAVQRMKKACKNSLKFNNVYDCVRPLLVFIGLFGMGGTRICLEDGVYTLRNSKFSRLVFTIVSLVYTPWFLQGLIVYVFSVREPPLPFLAKIALIMLLLKHFLSFSTVAIGCIMTHVYCKRLTTIFQIINDIDSLLAQANIRVQHWKITLKVTVLTLITANYHEILALLRVYHIVDTPAIVLVASIQLLCMWTILFLLMIHERFVGLNKLLQENATLTNSSIQVVGEKNPRDSYMLRCITLARHVHEQLTEVVHLFSDTCRYVIVGLTVLSIIDTVYTLLVILTLAGLNAKGMHIMFLHTTRIVVLIGICQANKSERRDLNARLRHLVAFETDRDIIRQVQQYIMYNAYSAPGLIDFQFTDIDNVLLLTIIDVIVSNALIIYSYTRHWHKL